MALFTKEELEALRLADEEIEASFTLTSEDLKRSRALDKQAKVERMDNRSRRIAAQKAAYYEANREKIAAQQAAYREANREKIAAQKAAYREENREKYNAYMREYMRARRQRKACTA